MKIPLKWDNLNIKVMVSGIGKMNWVQKRAKCTILDTFNSIIAQINKDISLFNGLNKDIRKDRLICMSNRQNAKVVSDGKETYYADESRNRIEPLKNTDKEIIIKAIGNKIIAYIPGINGTDTIEILPVWNKETLVCDFYNADKSKSYSLSQISQMIIGDFLFEEI